MKTIASKTIPHFKSEREEADFWQKHSVTEFEDGLEEVTDVHFPKPRKRLISLRIDDRMVASLKKAASRRGIGYLTLIRIWISDRLYRENPRSISRG